MNAQGGAGAGAGGNDYGALKTVVVGIFSFLVVVGVVVGGIFGLTALTGSPSLAYYLAFAAGALTGIPLIISLLRTHYFSRKRAVIIDAVVLAVGLILFVSFYSGWRPWLPGVVLVVGGIVFVVVGLMAVRGRPAFLEWLGGIYNTEKALGGTTFGDFGAFIGAIGAIGAHTKFGGDAMGWYWMGHIGALLAFAASFSVLWRWLRFEDNPVPAYLGLLGTLVTLVSLALTEWGNDLAAAVFPGVVWGLLLLAVVALLLIVLFYPVRRHQALRVGMQWGNQTAITGLHLVALIVITFLALAVFAMNTGFLTQNWSSDATKPYALWLNAAALAFWILGESYSVWTNRETPWSPRPAPQPAAPAPPAVAQPAQAQSYALNYQAWEKNIWEIFAGGTLLYFTLSPLWEGATPTDAMTYIFILGIAFGLLGTLRGMMVGIISKYE